MTDEEPLDPRAAADLIEQTTAHARSSLQVSTGPLYAGWGVAWFFGLGAMWLSVRDQVPYRGPSAWAATVLTMLIVAAVAVTIGTVQRATRGVEGVSEVQGRLFGLSWLIGFAALFAVEGALIHHGAGEAVMGLITAVGPLLVTSLIYLVGAAVWLDWPMFIMGAWLAAVAGLAPWTGAGTVLLVEAVGAGGGFLLMAAWLALRGRAPA